MNLTLPHIEPSPEDMSLTGGEYTFDCLCTWQHIDQGDKIMLREYQETFMGDVQKLQDVNGRGRGDKEIEYRVGKIWEGTIMTKRISRQGDSLDIQTK